MESLNILLGLAVLAPLAAFFIILLLGNQLGRNAGFVSITAIGGAAVLSFIALGSWVGNHFPEEVDHHAHATHAQGGESHDHDKDGHGHDKDGHDKDGHDKDGHDKDGHDKDGHDKDGHDKDGHDKDGHDKDGHDKDGEAKDPAAADDGHKPSGHGKPYSAGTYWTLGVFNGLRVEIGYYIDSLTICMFAMVTLIATCIHVYAWGYMHDEESEFTDPEVTLSNGELLKRPGRFHRFFQSLSLFCFSMLGLVLAGNIAMVFVFWELVGICSYFLIGFYVERKSASTAANKAFIVNRIGDFGMIIGLMALWSSLGTFAFEEMFDQARPGPTHALQTPDGMVRFSAREEMGSLVAAMGPSATAEEIEASVAEATEQWRGERKWGAPHGYWLLVVAGLGIFCGCVGKSAQFPLHVWLPDAMEGPTPVSALVHSATMVAAGVYLVGRFFPLFLPEVLLVIAIVGCITLFMAATIAITATDIKRVLAYSTVSQLGYMMLALGLGGWVAGLMHLITHAFFKSLLFMCSGSVIHAVHTNEMTEMGGLRKKMPVTAYTMLIGCLAIAGAGLPFILAGSSVGFSGFYSKDLILEQAFSFMKTNGGVGTLFFAAAAGGAAITSFYMFRLWYLTFAGEPRNQERYDHAHESPSTMYMPLIVLSVFAIGVGWHAQEAFAVGLFGLLATGVLGVYLKAKGKLEPAADGGNGDHSHGDHGDHSHSDHSHGDHHDHGPTDGHGEHGHEHGHGHGGGFALSPRGALMALGAISGALLVFAFAWKGLAGGRCYLVLANLLEQGRHEGTLAAVQGVWTSLIWPSEPDSHAYQVPITILATGAALTGFALATLMYGLKKLNPDEVRRQFQPVYHFLRNKWWFDELYQWVFVAPTHWISAQFARVDRTLLDGLVHWMARTVRRMATLWERLADQIVVDGLVNLVARWTWNAGASLRAVQTGSLRQYVMFIVVGAVAIFLVISFFWNPAVAG